LDRWTWHAAVAEIAWTGIVDTHEHILVRQQRRQADPDLFDWIAASYYYAALLASGMPAEGFQRPTLTTARAGGG
jgi:hypothetical protein